MNENEGHMTEGEFAEMAADALTEGMAEQFGLDVSTRSFEAAGMLTGNDGFTVRFQDGTTFQVTVVRA